MRLDPLGDARIFAAPGNIQCLGSPYRALGVRQLHVCKKKKKRSLE